jgi:YidC/Oxa1 family membrane protein insertase
MVPSVLAAGFLGIDHFTPPWDVFFLPLFNLLIAFYHLLFSDFALAIIVFTVAIRTILAPLFVQQIRSQKEMQRMQPLVREVQRKHKGNQQKISAETMALYKEHGVSPTAGCLPLILQLPILFALYQALIRASSDVTFQVTDALKADFTKLQAALHITANTAAGAHHWNVPVSGPCNLPLLENSNFTHFLPLNCQLIDPLKLSDKVQTTVSWLFNPFNSLHPHLNLAATDQTFALVIGGFSLSALAIIAAVLQFVQVKMTSPRPNRDDPTSSATSTMTYLFPLLTVFWGGIFPSGLILYWVVYTAYLVVQQFLIMGTGNLFPILGWSPAFATASGSAGDKPPSRQIRGEQPAVVADPPPSPQPNQPGARQRSTQRRPPGQRRRGRRR